MSTLYCGLWPIHLSSNRMKDKTQLLLRLLGNDLNSSHKRARIQRAELSPISVVTFLAAFLFCSRLISK
jgi:hypothetical protein